MGRKKKAVVENTDAQVNNKANIGYQGNVKVSIAAGKKIISTKNYHNAGCFKLFEFICSALSGSGSYNSKNRPCQIMLFTGTDSEEITNPIFSDVLSITPYVLQDTSGTIDRTEAAANKCSVIYHFRIPYSFIQKTEGISTKIYKAAIFGINARYDSPDADKSAYFLFKDPTGASWDPIVLQSLAVGNYSIILEWTMTLSNLTTSN